jgi:hypothetical protein
MKDQVKIRILKGNPKRSKDYFSEIGVYKYHLAIVLLALSLMNPKLQALASVPEITRIVNKRKHTPRKMIVAIASLILFRLLTLGNIDEEPLTGLYNFLGWGPKGVKRWAVKFRKLWDERPGAFNWYGIVRKVRLWLKE